MNGKTFLEKVNDFILKNKLEEVECEVEDGVFYFECIIEWAEFKTTILYKMIPSFDEHLVTEIVYEKYGVNFENADYYDTRDITTEEALKLRGLAE